MPALTPRSLSPMAANQVLSFLDVVDQCALQATSSEWFAALAGASFRALREAAARTALAAANRAAAVNAVAAGVAAGTSASSASPLSSTPAAAPIGEQPALSSIGVEEILIHPCQYEGAMWPLYLDRPSGRQLAERVARLCGPRLKRITVVPPHLRGEGTAFARGWTREMSSVPDAEDAFGLIRTRVADTLHPIPLSPQYPQQPDEYVAHLLRAVTAAPVACDLRELAITKCALIISESLVLAIEGLLGSACVTQLEVLAVVPLVFVGVHFDEEPYYNFMAHCEKNGGEAAAEYALCGRVCAAVRRATHVRSVRHLELAGALGGPLGDMLGDSPHLASVTHLILDLNSIVECDDHGLRFMHGLSRAACLPRLQKLSLENTGAPLGLLASMVVVPSSYGAADSASNDIPFSALEELHVYGCDEFGLPALIRALGNHPAIQRLRVFAFSTRYLMEVASWLHDPLVHPTHPKLALLPKTLRDFVDAVRTTPRLGTVEVFGGYRGCAQVWDAVVASPHLCRLREVTRPAPWEFPFDRATHLAHLRRLHIVTDPKNLPADGESLLRAMHMTALEALAVEEWHALLRAEEFEEMFRYDEEWPDEGLTHDDREDERDTKWRIGCDRIERASRAVAAAGPTLSAIDLTHCDDDNRFERIRRLPQTWNFQLTPGSYRNESLSDAERIARWQRPPRELDNVTPFRTARLIAGALHLASLRELSLNFNVHPKHFPALFVAMFDARHLSQLTVLRMQLYKCLRPYGVALLARLLEHGTHLASLEKLDMDVAVRDSPSLARIALALERATHLERLRSLTLRSNARVNAIGFERRPTTYVVATQAVSSLILNARHLARLEHLDVEGVVAWKPDHQSPLLEAISQAVHLTRLVTLRLSGAPMHGALVVEMATALGRNTSLGALRLVQATFAMPGEFDRLAREARQYSHLQRLTVEVLPSHDQAIPLRVGLQR